MDNNEKITIIALIFSLGPIFALLPILFLGPMARFLSFLFLVLPPFGVILGIISARNNPSKRTLAIIAIIIGLITSIMTLSALMVMLNPELAASYLPNA